MLKLLYQRTDADGLIAGHLTFEFFTNKWRRKSSPNGSDHSPATTEEASGNEDLIRQLPKLTGKISFQIQISFKTMAFTSPIPNSPATISGEQTLAPKSPQVFTSTILSLKVDKSKLFLLMKPLINLLGLGFQISFFSLGWLLELKLRLNSLVMDCCCVV